MRTITAVSVLKFYGKILTSGFFIFFWRSSNWSRSISILTLINFINARGGNLKNIFMKNTFIFPTPQIFGYTTSFSSQFLNRINSFTLACLLKSQMSWIYFKRIVWVSEVMQFAYTQLILIFIFSWGLM